jgi:hypothetical protein
MAPHPHLVYFVMALYVFRFTNFLDTASLASDPGPWKQQMLFLCEMSITLHTQLFKGPRMVICVQVCAIAARPLCTPALC